MGRGPIVEADAPNPPHRVEAGAVALEAKRGPKGEVVGVKTSGANGLPAEMLSCISAALRAASFEAPPGASATLTMPFNLTRYPPT